MTEKAIRIVGTVAVSSDLFREKILSNPQDLTKALLAVASELDGQDIALITLAVAGANGDAKKFFRDLDRLTQERYHPKPPWAV